MPTILIAESLSFDVLQAFCKEHDCGLYEELPNDLAKDKINFIYQPDITATDLKNIIPDYAGLIVRPKEVSAETILSAKNLELIIRGGAGVNSIDVATATQQNIKVLNTPGQNSIATAEYSFALILELLARRNISRANKDVKSGTAKQPEPYGGFELKGKSLAIIGFGNVGKALAKRAAAFEMNLHIYSRSLTPEIAEQYGAVFHDNVDSIISAGADAISLHTPLNQQSHFMLNSQRLALLQKPTYIINTARPALIDPEAFAAAIANNKIAGFAIDGDLAKFPDEPGTIDPFVTLDKTQIGIITHHIADCTKEAQANITRQVLKQTLGYFVDGVCENQVN